MIMARKKARRDDKRAVLAAFLKGIDRRIALRSGMVLLASLVLALAAARFALSSVVLGRDPALARMAGDPRARLRDALQRASVDPALLARLDLTEAARRSLRYAPLDPVPLRALAMQATARQLPSEASRFAALSEQVTRRDIPTQLMLIEEAVGKNDYVAALHHYDIALSTRAQVRDILFPVLSSALADADIQRALTPYVARRANWMRAFIDFAMRDGLDGPARTARLLLSTGGWRNADLMVATAPVLLGLLADQREFPLMLALYARLPGMEPRLPRMAGFNAYTIDPKSGPLAWYGQSEASMGASFDVGTSGSSKPPRIFAGSGERGVVLRRLLALAPGEYRLDESRQFVTGGGGARAIWTMRCANDANGRILWTGPDSRAAYRVTGIPGPIIPADCPMQRLELEAIGGDDSRGLELVIDRFDLRQ
jgi:hypothetical protein